MKRLALISLLLLIPSVSFAHKVSLFVDVSGNEIELSSYFSDGTPVKGGDVKVYDSLGKAVFEGRTNKEGELHFTLKKPGTYKAVVLAELGHRAEATFKVNGERKEENIKGNMKDTQELREVIREELKPIKEELLKIEEENSKPSLRDAIGGIGWILGIFGGAVLLSRRRGG
ncbi:nickel transport protein [Thermovibrio guaymasensis]|uniref:Nickel transport protein n=1 Tax=Thermovibrio guaymasensis TaxID=240167 RepID=A0A420W5K1_9BACT|nr:hypothetical protein [Thermovibrio guaymasensis]RKQ60340.1 nickel transport protein [Thermovibrio guaymasensis]